MLPARPASLQASRTNNTMLLLLLVFKGPTAWMLPANETSQLGALVCSSILPCGLTSSAHTLELWLSLPAAFLQGTVHVG